MSANVQTLQQGAINASIVLIVTDPNTGLPIDADEADTLGFIFTKPDGTALVVVASLLSDGDDGALQYITQAGDLSLAGQYSVQAQLVFPSGYVGDSSIAQFTVQPNS
jgi:hypothetical protein